MKSKEIFIATWEENKEREESGHQNTDEGFSESQSEFHDFFTGLRNFWHRVAVSPRPPFFRQGLTM